MPEEGKEFDLLESIEAKETDAQNIPLKIRKITSHCQQGSGSELLEGTCKIRKSKSAVRRGSSYLMMNSSRARKSDKASRIRSNRESWFVLDSSPLKRMASKSASSSVIEEGHAPTSLKTHMTLLHNSKRRVVDYFASESKAAKATRSLASFLPTSLLKKLNEPERPITPEAESGFAILMLADISGFTKLGERLCAKGREGVDELSTTINDYFSILIRLVNSYSGDILNFAGDALIIRWADESMGKREKAQQAIQCGQALANLEKFDLTVHVGIGCGHMAMLTCGGYDDYWCYVGVGRPFLEMAEAEGAAGPKEMVISSSVHAILKDAVEGKQVNDGGCFLVERIVTFNKPIASGGFNFSFSDGPEGLEERRKFSLRMSHFLPPTTAGVLQAGGSYLNELRMVTVCFSMFGGFKVPLSSSFESDDDAANVLREIHQPLVRFQKVLSENGGMLRQFILDDKGCVFIACFGLSGFVHENNMECAVSYALDLRDAAEEYDLTVCTGVTSGNAFCGGVGSQDRREYAMMGKVVNLSARMMVHSSKSLKLDQNQSITCDAATSSPIKRMFTMKKSGPVSFKGIKDPIPVYHPIKRKSPQEKTSAPKDQMVGRQYERDVLTKAFKALHDSGASAAFTVEGPAGLGKSTLVSHVRGIIKKAGDSVAALTSRGLRQECNTPYFAFYQVLGSLLGIESNHTEEESRVLIQELLDHICEQDPDVSRLSGNDVAVHKRAVIFPILKSAFRLKWAMVHGDKSGNATSMSSDDVAKRAAFNSAQTRWVLRTLMLYGLQRVEAQYIAVVVEDVHFIDSCSWGMIEELWNVSAGFGAVAKKPIAIVMTLRPKEVRLDEYESFVRATACRVLELKPLTRAELIELLSITFEGESWPENSIEYIMEHGNGNPFVCKEIARSLHRKRDSINETMENTKSVLESAVIQRFDLILKSHQAILKTASVIGNEFLVDQLCKVLPRSVTRNMDVLTCLRELEMDDWLEEVNPEPLLSFSFQHDLLRSVVYNLNMTSKQKYLHLATAHYMEKVFFEDLRPYFTLLAYHYRKANDIANTIKYLLYSLRDSIAMEAMQEAIYFIDKALLLKPSVKLLMDIRSVVSSGLKFHKERGKIMQIQTARALPVLKKENTGTLIYGGSTPKNDPLKSKSNLFRRNSFISACEGPRDILDLLQFILRKISSVIHEQDPSIKFDDLGPDMLDTGQNEGKTSVRDDAEGVSPENEKKGKTKTCAVS